MSGADPIKQTISLAEVPLRNVKLRDAGGIEFPNLGRSGRRSSSSIGMNGHGELRFGPVVFGDYDKAVLRGDGFSVLKDELNIRIPLDFGASYPKKMDFMDGTISVEKAARGAEGIMVQILTGVDRGLWIGENWWRPFGKRFSFAIPHELDLTVSRYYILYIPGRNPLSSSSSQPKIKE